MQSPADFVRQLDLLRYSHLASATLVFYDHFLTSGDEVEYIWKRRWSSSKILFLCNRYIGEFTIIVATIVQMSSHLSPKACLVCFKLASWAMTVVVFNTQVIMQFRLYALWEKSRIILAILVVLFSSEVVLVWTTTAGMMNSMRVTVEPFPGLHVCTITTLGGSHYLLYFPVLSFEVTLFVLTLWIFVKRYRASQEWQRGWSWEKSVINALILGNLSYFFYALTAYTISSVMLMTVSVAWFEVSKDFALAATIIIGCRLILSLLELHYQPITLQTSNRSAWTPDYVSRKDSRLSKGTVISLESQK